MRKLIVISLTIVSLLAACGSKELSDLTLIQALGVDGPGPVTLTAVGDEEEAPAIYVTRGADLIRAQAGLRDVGATRLEVTHVAQLVLGPDADVAGTLRQAVTDRDSGYGATVWLCRRGSAEEALSLAEDPARRLKALEENGGAAAPTALAALSALSETGRVTLPLLDRRGGELYLAGYETVEVAGI